MKKRVLIVFSLCVVVLIVSTGAWLAIDYKSRRDLLGRIVPAYHLYQLVSIRNDIRNRNFETVAARLDSYISLATHVNSGRSSLLSGLAELTNIVMTPVRFQSEFDALIPVLRKLTALDPDLYMGHVWLAEALRRKHPEEALAHIRKAIHLVNSDDRAYRIGLMVALELGNTELIHTLCKKYSDSQFGGPRQKNYRTLFLESGLRNMVLETRSTSGELILATNRGLQLNQRSTYNFILPEKSAGSEIVLHLGLLPGIEIMFHELRLMDQKTTSIYRPGEVALTTHMGFISSNSLTETRILSPGEGDEAIRIWLKNSPNRTFNSVEIDLTFSRLSISNHVACDFTYHN